MMGRALIFDGVKAFANTETLECQAYNNAFAEAGLPWLWDAQTLASFGPIEDGAERIRLYAADMQYDMTRMDVERLHQSVIRHFTARASRFGVPLQSGIDAAIERARKDGHKVGLASRNILAPAIRLYNSADLPLDALGVDVAATARILGADDMDVISGDRPLRLVESAAA